MNRRRFLGGLGAGIVAEGGTPGPGGRSWGEARVQAAAATRPAIKPPTSAVESPTASAPGVSARDVKIGMSAAFRGLAAGLGTELWRGTTAYFAEVNARGVDLGIGAPLTFGPERRQGLDSVYFTRVQGERWVPVTDWTSAVRA